MKLSHRFFKTIVLLFKVKSLICTEGLFFSVFLTSIKGVTYHIVTFLPVAWGGSSSD